LRFKWLDLTSTHSSRLTVDLMAATLRSRLQKALGVMTGLQKTRKSRNITFQTKLRLLTALVRPVATHGCESWTVRKADRRRIDAFALKTYRRLLHAWMAKKTNNIVCCRNWYTYPTVNCSLLKSVMRCKLRYFGRRLSCDIRENVWRKQVTQGCIEGNRPKAKGRSAKNWIIDFLEATNCTFRQLLRLTQNRQARSIQRPTVRTDEVPRTTRRK